MCGILRNYLSVSPVGRGPRLAHAAGSIGLAEMRTRNNTRATWSFTALATRRVYSQAFYSSIILVLLYLHHPLRQPIKAHEHRHAGNSAPRALLCCQLH